MTRQLSFTLQIGTRFDGGAPLIWSLMAEGVEGVLVPRPKHYRGLLAAYAAQSGGAPISPDTIDAMFGLEQVEGPRDLHCVLRVLELMQPSANFCPAGDWFYEIGPRAAGYCAALAPAPVTFMISLCNPAHLLSQAVASRAYPGIEVIAPDPFDLQWAVVLRALRDSCPDASIIAWNADEAPMVWGSIIEAAVQREASFSEAAKIRAARNMMNEEGATRLAQYLDGHEGMPDALRAQVISIFLKRFPHKDAVRPEIVLPGWDATAQARMDEHFADDLSAVAGIEGVTFIGL
ncbi:hypothetical protein [Tateyamaria sp. Alg231-49]|uniref:hypothetical protein n=1 Tax=Tateyamaria sp. Alg231-49 TaxID=1922219 RepID=UPI00131EF165|nr:hypothetical protein [Tateyamaria sp. Alg231-49]